MKIGKLRDMKDEELEHEVLSLKQALFNMRVQHATGQLEKPHQIKAAKRDLARVLTLIRQRKLAGEAVTKKEAR